MSTNTENLFGNDSRIKIDEATRLILKYWYTKCKVYYKCHKASAEYYDKLNKYMGIPTILVGIFNTTTIFANYTHDNQPLMIVNGTASFIATLLSTMQNYFDLSKLVITHQKLSNGYSKITHTIEKILMLEKLTGNNEISSKIIDSIMNQMEYLSQDSPTIPDKIWNKNKVELKGIISVILSTESIAKEIESSVSRNNITNNNPKNNNQIAINIPPNKPTIIDTSDEKPADKNSDKSGDEIVYDNTSK